MHVYCSTQHPTEMQHVVAHALQLRANQVVVEMRRMGGGFGGKESQSALFACVAAVAAQKLRRPVKVRLDRDDDFLITGKRHCFHYEYEAGFDDDGLIRAAKVTMTARAGFSADLSGPVVTRAVCHFDNTYYLSDVDIRACAGKTNTQSNTAFRGFGGPQGAIAIEHIIDSIARELGRDPLDVRRINFYGTDRARRDAVRHAGRGQRDPRAGRRARGVVRLPPAPRGGPRVQRAQPVLKKGHRADPGEVRDLVQRRALQPGRGAGARLHRRLGAGEPRRDRDGAGPQHQGGAGRRARAGHRPRARALHGRRHQQGRQHVGHRRVDRHRSRTAWRRRMPRGRSRHGSRRSPRAGTAAPPRTSRSARTPSASTARSCRSRSACAEAYEARVQLWSDGFYATPKLHWDRQTHDRDARSSTLPTAPRCRR